MSKEIRAFWDTSTLSEYVALERIPRDLRIKKCPTFELHDKEHKKKWTGTLPDCSIALMKIIILSKSKEIKRFQNEINNRNKERENVARQTGL